MEEERDFEEFFSTKFRIFVADSSDCPEGNCKQMKTQGDFVAEWGCDICLERARRRAPIERNVCRELLYTSSEKVKNDFWMYGSFNYYILGIDI